MKYEIVWDREGGGGSGAITIDGHVAARFDDAQWGTKLYEHALYGNSDARNQIALQFAQSLVSAGSMEEDLMGLAYGLADDFLAARERQTIPKED